MFWGVAIISFSGLVVWFPEFFTRFLPGWAINIAPGKLDAYRIKDQWFQ